MDTPGGVAALFRVGVWQALRRARAGRDGGSEDGCMCVASCAAGRAGVPPRHKKRAACAALEIHGWKIRRHSGVCRCQCSTRRSRSPSEINGIGVNVKPSGVR